MNLIHQPLSTDSGLFLLGKTAMSKKKNVTTQENKFDYKAPPITAQTQAVIDSSNQLTEDPSIRQRYATLENDARNSTADPYGAYSTPFLREKTQNTRIMDLLTNRSKDLAENRFNAQNQQFGRQVTAAGLTNPQLIQTGGTSTNTQSGGFWGDLLLGGVQAAGQVGAGAAS